jgi:hypothetical protein
MKFHENPSSGCRIVPAKILADGQTVMTKLIVAFSNPANAPKMSPHIPVRLKSCKNDIHLQDDLGKFTRKGTSVIKGTIASVVAVFTVATKAINVCVVFVPTRTH